MAEFTPERDLIRGLESTLASVLPSGWQAKVARTPAVGGTDADLEVLSPVGDRIAACVEAKGRAEPAQLVREVGWLQRCERALVVAPRLSTRAREILSEAGISWLEPDGDCRIAMDGLYIERLGVSQARPDRGAAGTRYVANVFAGGALRVVRWLLIEPQRSWTLEDMANRTGLTLGFVSRVFKTLARDAYMDRARGANRVRDRDALLDAWAATARRKDAVSERVATVPSTESLLQIIRDSSGKTRYAITAEAAADRIAPFARFSRVEMYVDNVATWDQALGLTAVPRGGNLVLIEPTDTGVFDGAFEGDGLQLVSRPQLYVDLVRRGGAAVEAAAFMRERGELWL